MTLQFEHETHAQRVVFGAGAAREQLGAEVARLGGNRVLLMSSPSSRDLARAVTAMISVVGTVSDVRMHVPFALAEDARGMASELRANLVLSIGGGSTTGMAKAVALTSGLPILAVPTTYAGSEATPVWGITQDGRKATGHDVRVLPRTVVYDPELLATLSTEMTVSSGLNALAHCVDSQWAPRADPINSALGLEGTRAIVDGLRSISAHGIDLDRCGRCLYGAHLAALSFASAGSGLHHKICHILGGTWNLPHAQTHAVMLPHVLAFNSTAAPEAADRLAGALGADDAVEGLLSLNQELNAPRSLRELGMPESALPQAAALVAEQAPPSNPRHVDRANAEQLLRRAWSGQRPHSDR